MVSEEIITALRNAIERGEDLQRAINVLINSGYNARDVQEASNFVGSGTIRNLQPRSDEHLTMPSEKSYFSNNPVTYSNQVQNQNIQQSFKQESSQIKQEVSRDMFTKTESKPTGPLSEDISKISPRKERESYTVEIVLILVLLILIGVLVSTFLFKDKILSFFQGLG